jgi:hypothetical protein
VPARAASGVSATTKCAAAWGQAARRWRRTAQTLAAPWLGLSLRQRAVRRPNPSSDQWRIPDAKAGQAHEPPRRPSSAGVRPPERRPPRSKGQKAVSPGKVSSERHGQRWPARSRSPEPERASATESGRWGRPVRGSPGPERGLHPRRAATAVIATSPTGRC